MAEPSPGPSDRPRVWVNCAVSLDGRLAFAGGVRARLSGPEDLVRVHRLRAASDAILVGVGTVIQDDPSLAVRGEWLEEPAPRPPLRVVVDGSGRTPPTARILDTGQPTIVATTSGNPRPYPSHVRVIRAGVDTVDLAGIFRQLRGLGVERLMVEGGSQILASVARAELWDRWTVYYAPVVIGGATAPPMLGGPETTGPTQWHRFRCEAVAALGDGFLATFSRPPG